MKCETLHLCNLDEKHDFSCYEHLITDDDAVVFYANSVSKNKQHELMLKFNGKKLYFVGAENSDDYAELVELVNKYQRTMTWK